MTLPIIDLNFCLAVSEQPSAAVIVVVAVVVFVVSTVISGFAAYKIKRRSLQSQADKEKKPATTDRKE